MIKTGELIREIAIKNVLGLSNSVVRAVQKDMADIKKRELNKVKIKRINGKYSEHKSYLYQVELDNLIDNEYEELKSSLGLTDDERIETMERELLFEKADALQELVNEVILDIWDNPDFIDFY